MLFAGELWPENYGLMIFNDLFDIQIKGGKLRPIKNNL